MVRGGKAPLAVSFRPRLTSHRKDLKQALRTVLHVKIGTKAADCILIHCCSYQIFNLSRDHIEASMPLTNIPNIHDTPLSPTHPTFNPQMQRVHSSPEISSDRAGGRLDAARSAAPNAQSGMDTQQFAR